jgi:hypothetical protein
MELRDVGRLSFREVGRRLGVSERRAQAIHREGVSRRATTPECFQTLSVPAVKGLENLYLTTKQDVRAAILEGRLSLHQRPRNFGVKCWQEVMAWLAEGEA